MDVDGCGSTFVFIFVCGPGSMGVWVAVDEVVSRCERKATVSVGFIDPWIPLLYAHA